MSAEVDSKGRTFMRRRIRIGWALMLAGAAVGCSDRPSTAPQAAEGRASDMFRVTLGADVSEDAMTGRLLVLFINETGNAWANRSPCFGPFEESPQPIAAVDVRDFEPGSTLTFADASLDAFPESPGLLDGKVRIQAVLDCDATERHHMQGPGNVVSDIVEVDLNRATTETIDLTLSRMIDGPGALAPESEHLQWFQLRSDMLSDFAGRDVFHNAGVALPPGYHEDESRRWPVVYVTPEFARRHHDATQYATMFATPGIERVAPMAIHVVLDPESALGHHGFADSENNGPRATALVEELIRHIESHFRIDSRPAARIVTGHGAGAWAALWLQIQHPDTFGACWATSPDPVSFMMMQMTNIYSDENFFEYAPDHETVGLMDHDLANRPITLSTQRQQARMESILGPGGTSGMRLDSWEARYSPRNNTTGLPAPLFDPDTGRIDPSVAEHWKQRDISIQIVRNWELLGPIMKNRIRLMCGELDSYAFDRGVRLLIEEMNRMDRESPVPAGEGYIEIVPDQTHWSLRGRIFTRINKEMRTYLRDQGYEQ